MCGGIHGGYFGKYVSTGSGRNRPPSRLNSELIGLFSSACSIFYMAQGLHNSFASDITGNDFDARVKNRVGIEKQWNLR
jgi:hypothetical protein